MIFWCIKCMESVEVYVIKMFLIRFVELVLV